MKPRILIQIDTYIKDQDTIDLTKECIRRARLLGFPILLTAHCDLSKDLTDLVDYHEIDLLNPALEENGQVSLLTSYSSSHEIQIALKNADPHAPACLTSLINGAKFAKRNGFDFFLRIEFDSIIKFGFIEDLKKLLEASTQTNGLVFTNFGKWIDGKIILFNSEIYLKCFDVSIFDGNDYMDFVKKEEVPEKDWRHLQTVQYHILRKNTALQNCIIAPTGFLEKIIDRNFNKIREKEIGIFRPGMILGSDGNSFVTIAQGFARTIAFQFEIYHGDILQQSVEQYFLEFNTTFKLFPIQPGTLHKIVYTNPITGEIESWEFTSAEELKKLATIKFK